jgi:hypothetical protein
MSEGFGICGHKNSYSTGVKVGNYVEDRIGGGLARDSGSKPLARLTECHANFVDPAMMPDKCVNAPKENLEERFMLRQGLPYSILFEHGKEHIPTPAELQSKYTPTSHDIGSGLLSTAIKGKSGLLTGTDPASPANSRLRELEMKRAKEARELRHAYVSTSQSIVPAITRGRIS